MVTGSLKGAPLRYKLKMYLPLQVNGQQPSSLHHLNLDVTTSICLCCLSPSNHRSQGKHVGRWKKDLRPVKRINFSLILTNCSINWWNGNTTNGQKRIKMRPESEIISHRIHCWPYQSQSQAEVVL